MRMTERVIVVGAMLVLLTAGFSVAFLPSLTMPYRVPSDIARPYTPLELQGRFVYIQNGCTYCHSQYIRPQDWGHGAVRISQLGDYAYDRPHLLGSERTGPDLVQEGGLRVDDWHMAHFMNPRFTRPASIMPRWEALTRNELTALIAYLQSLGGKMADARVGRLREWQAPLRAAYARGEDFNYAYLHSLVPAQWATLPNPYPADADSLAHGKYVYEQMCIGCHGNFGGGDGPAARWLNPPPANFNALRRVGASGGLLYYQIMNGVTGTAMMSFKRELESAKIWDVSNYVAANFIGQSDGNTPPRGVDEVQEPVDPTAPAPPPLDSITQAPPTSPALQPGVTVPAGPPTGTPGALPQLRSAGSGE